MQSPLNTAEFRLALGLFAILALACLGPNMVQYAHYHEFADQRDWLGLPCALDVLSNIPFALLGAWGLLMLHRDKIAARGTAKHALATLFFGGLVLTATCSTWYHLQPNDVRLVADRLGIVVAFTGLLGMAVSDRISNRAGLVVACLSVLAGPVAVYLWVLGGNLLPWSAFQLGGMVLVLILAFCKPVEAAWNLPLLAVVGWYTLAKFLELGDGIVYWASGELVSGHTLKHLAAAMAALPILSLMHNGAHKTSDRCVSQANGLGLQ